MDFHPIANIFPMLPEAELESLAADIKANGLLEPITVCEGKVLDGRNRYNACITADVTPVFVPYAGDDPLAFVVSKNLMRRHLTREQRDEVIRQLRAQGMTLQKIANVIGVSHPTVMRALISDCTNVQSEIQNERGQLRPAHYASRQPQDDEPQDDEEEDFFTGRCSTCIYLQTHGEDWWCTKLERPTYVEYNVCDSKLWQSEEPEANKDEQTQPEKPHVSFNSGNNEWHTPPEYIAAARLVLGDIDLDPASSDIANNTIVHAAVHFTREDDGLAKQWAGRIWLNPPYASELIGRFADKLHSHISSGDVSEAIVLVNNATETEWFNTILSVSNAVVFPNGRVKFLKPDGTTPGAPLQGQAVIYSGPNTEKFLTVFSRFGWGATLWTPQPEGA